MVGALAFMLVQTALHELEPRQQLLRNLGIIEMMRNAPSTPAKIKK